MIVEGYSLHLYCDTLPRCESDLNKLPIRAEIAGRNRKDAWKQAKSYGWLKRRDKVYCRGCVQKQRESQDSRST